MTINAQQFIDDAARWVERAEALAEDDPGDPLLGLWLGLAQANAQVATAQAQVAAAVAVGAL